MSTTERASTNRKKKKKRPADGSMSLVEHIQEFRRRLIISLFALGIATIFGFWWYQNNLLWFGSLGDILVGPYCSLPPEARVTLAADGECKLLATAPFEMFMLRLKVGALAGSVFASPVWLAQLWGFITPGLMKNERRWTFTFVSIAVTLFVAGAVMAYFVLAYGLQFLLMIGAETSATALNGQLYFEFMLGFLLVFGISFEVPLIISMLNIMGVLHYEQLRRKRRLIIMLLAVFAAFITPGQEAITMLILFIALVILVEISLQFVRFNDRRRDRQRPEWLDLDDDESSPITASDGLGSADGLGSSGPIERPTPISQLGPETPNSVSDLSQRGGADFDDVL